MTDSEKLDLLLVEMQGTKSEIQSVKTEMQEMKSDMQNMKTEMQEMKSDMQNMKTEMQEMKSDIRNMKTEMKKMKSDIQKLDDRVTSLNLHIENVTDKNIMLLAENFGSLTDKLNQAIPAADKNLVYEVKVNYLIEKVGNFEKEMKEMRSMIA